MPHCRIAALPHCRIAALPVCPFARLLLISLSLLLLLPVSACADGVDYQNFHDLAPGFGGHLGKGQAGTTTDPDNPETPRERFGLDGLGCPGYISASDDPPNHRFWVVHSVDLILTLSSDINTVLVIAGPVERSSNNADKITHWGWGDLLCNGGDGAGHQDGQISANFRPGEYHVWVGVSNLDDNAARYTLDIRENPETRRLPPGANFPDIFPGFGDSASSGYSGGNVNANSAHNSECFGYVDSKPNHTFTVTSTVDLDVLRVLTT